MLGRYLCKINHSRNKQTKKHRKQQQQATGKWMVALYAKTYFQGDRMLYEESKIAQQVGCFNTKRRRIEFGTLSTEEKSNHSRLETGKTAFKSNAH